MRLDAVSRFSGDEQTMKARKRAALKKAGWTVGAADEFLDLTADERVFVEVKIALADALKQRRERKKLTQAQVAKLLGSSHPEWRWWRPATRA